MMRIVFYCSCVSFGNGRCDDDGNVIVVDRSRGVTFAFERRSVCLIAVLYADVLACYL